MSKSEWKKWIGVVGRLLLAYALIFAQSALAGQNPQTKDKADSLQKAAAQQAGEKQSSAAPTAKAQSQEAEGKASERTAGEEKSSGGSLYQGIKLHGHWTIEVRNRDGSLARHVEFENALDPGFTASNAFGQSVVVPGGASYLSGLLSGQWSGPGNNAAPYLEIYLVGPAGLNSLGIDSKAPCTQGGEFRGACIIGPSCGGVQGGGLSCDLSITPVGAAPVFTGVRLTGDVQATQNGQISMVLTIIFSPSCTASFPNCGAPGIVSLTSSTNFPGAPISVIAGQLIAVTVNISFS